MSNATYNSPSSQSTGCLRVAITQSVGNAARCLPPQIDETLAIAKVLLGDLPGFEKFCQDATDLKTELQTFRRERFDDWSREVQGLIEDHKQPLW